MIYLQLLVSFVKIGLLGFGGGMAIIGLIQQEVERYAWMTPTEFVDIFAISQMTPGPIGINCATYTGYTAVYAVYGTQWSAVLGSIVATFAIILPSLVIMMVLSMIYFRLSARWSENRIYQWSMLAIRLLVLFLIGSAAYSLLDPEAIRAGRSLTMIDNFSWIIFAVVFYLTCYPVLYNLSGSQDKQQKNKADALLNRLSHPILLIIISGIVGLFIYL